MNNRRLHIALLLLLIMLATAASAVVPDAAAKDIGQANRDWATAMVEGNAKLASDAYAPGAVFCTVAGACTTGHDAIEQMTAARLAKTGKFLHADAHSTRRLEDHGLVYEWGKADLTTFAGERNTARYFTIWQRQPDGHWRILRNLVLP